MSDSIKKQICAELLDLLTPLKTAGTIRELVRVSDLTALAIKFPSVQMEIGPESPMEGDYEDNIGYQLQFPVHFKFTVANYRDKAGELEDLVSAAQVLIEADSTLDALANWLKYTGDAPFIHNVTDPVGGTVITYLVRYRRKKAAPTENY